MHSRYFCLKCGTELALNTVLCGNCAPNASAPPEPVEGADTVWVAAEKTGEMAEPQPDERQRVPDFAWLDEPDVMLNRVNPLQAMLEQEKGAWATGEARAFPNPVRAEARAALLGVGRGAGIPLRQACETLKATLDWVAAVAPPSEYQRWTRAFDALDRVTRHCAQTYHRDHERPEALDWQRHVCAAWARALGQGDVTAASAPTVTDLQAATAAKRAEEHARGAGVVVRMWAGALGIGRRERDTPEELIEHTLELVEREAEQQHTITNLHESVQQHRKTLVQLQQTGDAAIADIVRRWFAAKEQWRHTKHPDDTPFWEEMDACQDEMEAWAKAQPAPKPEETSDAVKD